MPIVTPYHMPRPLTYGPVCHYWAVVVTIGAGQTRRTGYQFRALQMPAAIAISGDHVVAVPIMVTVMSEGDISNRQKTTSWLQCV